MVFTLKIVQRLYHKFLLIRELEEEIVKRYNMGKMRCPTHLSIGQEGIAVAFSEIVKKKDFAISTHRPHAHYIAKGGNINKLIAELYGKKTGCSNGIGGSMHLIDLKVNFMGSSSILGNSIPIGVGLGFSSKINKVNNISFIFLGDGATEQGVFYESVNFSVIKKIPVIFICENNKYSVYSDLKPRQPLNRKIYKLTNSLGIKSFYSNGKNLFEMIKILKASEKYVKKNRKPCFVEIDTFRWYEHCGVNKDDNLNYRSKKELDKWVQKDHLKFLEKKLALKKNLIDKIKKKVHLEVQKAFNFAEKSKFPKNSDLFKGVYEK